MRCVSLADQPERIEIITSRVTNAARSWYILRWWVGGGGGARVKTKEGQTTLPIIGIAHFDVASRGKETGEV